LKDKGLLTKREQEIFQLVAAGLTDEEIAENLYLSIRTVNNHVASILFKYDIHDRKKIILLKSKNE